MTDSGTIEPLDLRFSEDELAARCAHIQDFIGDTVAAAGVDGAVLGLSGGIDSTTTAHLAARELGAENLHALVLPSSVSSGENMSDAEIVAENLGIGYDLIEINPIVDDVVAAYPEAEGDHEAIGNVRARVRGVLNYLVANHENRVVLGTGNRTEAMIGYFTKYGDQAVDCNPIGNLYKQQVRQLARYLDVPEQLVTKTPTAELWADQTDEQELGIDYDTLDAILALHVDGPLSVTATARQLDVEASVVEQVDGMVARSAHKRAMPPAPNSDRM